MQLQFCRRNTDTPWFRLLTFFWDYKIKLKNSQNDVTVVYQTAVPLHTNLSFLFFFFSILVLYWHLGKL